MVIIPFSGWCCYTSVYSSKARQCQQALPQTLFRSPEVKGQPLATTPESLHILTLGHFSTWARPRALLVTQPTGKIFCLCCLSRPTLNMAAVQLLSFFSLYPHTACDQTVKKLRCNSHTIQICKSWEGQTWAFSCPFSWLCRTPCMAINASSERDTGAAVVGDLGTVPSVPTQAQLQMHISSYDGLRLGLSHFMTWQVQQMQLFMNSCMVTWLPQGQAFCLYQDPFRNCFSRGIKPSTADGMALLQNPRGLHCDTPTGDCHRLHNVSFFLPLTPPA